MREVIHFEKDMDHSPALLIYGVGKHNFKPCRVAEMSDVDAAVARAIADCKSHADLRAKQVADAKADLTYVQELDARVEQLRCQIEGFINALAGRPTEGVALEKAVQQYEERITLSQRKILNKLRDELDKLEIRLREVEKPPADTMADLATVQEMGCRVEQLRLQTESIINALSGKPTAGGGLEKVVQQFEEKINLSSRKPLNRLSEELEKLKQEVAFVTNQLPKPSSTDATLPRNPTDGQIQEVEARLLKKIETEMREADEKILKLEQRTLSSEHDARLQTQVEQLIAWRSSSFLRRLQWLLRGW